MKQVVVEIPLTFGDGDMLEQEDDGCDGEMACECADEISVDAERANALQTNLSEM